MTFDALRTIRLLLISFLFFLVPVVDADPVWRIEAQTGSAYSFDTTLKIDQREAEDFRFSADYETKPFEGAPYSAWRISRWNENHGWEIEFLHHKIYLKNTPPGIQTFRISNGYNMLLMNHAWELRNFTLRAGAGAVVAFPISVINDVVTDGGYRLAGFGGQGSISRRFYLIDRFFLSIEAKLTVARAGVTLSGGTQATAPNVALHGLAGIGFDL
jgi:hypothetical protein